MSRKKLLDHTDQSELQITFSNNRIRGFTWWQFLVFILKRYQMSTLEAECDFPQPPEQA